MDSIAWAIVFLAIFEGLQLSILSWQAWQIRRKMANILPEGLTAGQAMADGVMEFMKRINNNPEDAKVVGGFVRGCAIVGWDEISKRVPMLNNQANPQMEKMLARNPWASVAMGIAQAVVPHLGIKEKVDAAINPNQPPASPPSSSGGF